MRRTEDPSLGDRIGPAHILVLCTVVVLLMSAVSLANLSVPLIAESELRPTTAEQTWFVDAFVLAFACSLLPAEMIGARWGEARVLVAGLALFAAANAVAIAAPDMAVLIVSRALAGLGAGIALPQSLSVLLHRSDRARHAPLVAAWTAATSAAGIVGNGIGGWLLSAGGWRSAFTVTAPAAVLVAIAVIAIVGLRDKPDRRAPLDLVGTALFVVAAVAALVALIEAPTLIAQPALLAGVVALAGLAGALFWMRESRAAHPLLRIEVFGIAAVRAAALGIVATFVGLFTLFSLNARLVQTVRELDAWVAGLVLVPVSVTMLITTYASVRLVRRFGLGRVVAAGLLLSAAGYALLVLTLEGPLLAYEVALVVIGTGAGLCSSPLSTRLTSEYSAAEGRAGSGINSTLRELASAGGVGIAGLSLAIWSTDPDEVARVVDGTRGAALVVVLLLVGSCVAMLIDTRRARSR